jgi:hypothetical protein
MLYRVHLAHGRIHLQLYTHGYKTYMMFIYLSSEQLSAIMEVRQGEQLAISRSHAHIAIVSFRLHRMYTVANPFYIRP